MTIRAENRYPLASTKSARVRWTENCENSRTEVMKSVTNIVASKEGTKASTFASCWCANGARATSPASINAETASAARTWRGVGGRLISDVSTTSSLISGKIEDLCHAPMSSQGQL